MISSSYGLLTVSDLHVASAKSKTIADSRIGISRIFKSVALVFDTMLDFKNRLFKRIEISH